MSPRMSGQSEAGTMRMKRRSWAAVVVLAVLPAAGCTAARDDGAALSAPATSAAAVPVEADGFSFAVSPAEGATDVPVSVEIGTEVAGGTVTAVTLREAGGGRAVAGGLREDGSAWVPGKPLKNSQEYEATVTATDASGATRTVTTSFVTMAKPAKETGTGLYLFDGNSYGVAMPVVVEFHPGIKEKDRAAVQQRLFVTSDPPQPGTWSWVSNGAQAYYRAPDFWQPGTTLTVRIAVGGHPTGGGRYGDRDRSATVEIGRDLRMSVDNSTKQMTVTQDGRVLRTMPVSLGKKSTPSSSGTMVVMEKKKSTVFDTTDEVGPNVDRYRVDIDLAQRLTWGGEYIHAAAWSVGDQGRRNVSHGCVNLSPSNARWLFDRSKVGDPVTVKGTERKLVAGNGWTAWDLSWDEFKEGSALPVPDDLAPKAA
jgi:lipoprotein-anchoring transpeptidase ErfK/SrfK